MKPQNRGLFFATDPPDFQCQKENMILVKQSCTSMNFFFPQYKKKRIIYFSSEIFTSRQTGGRPTDQGRSTRHLMQWFAAESVFDSRYSLKQICKKKPGLKTLVTQVYIFLMLRRANIFSPFISPSPLGIFKELKKGGALWGGFH